MRAEVACMVVQNGLLSDVRFPAKSATSVQATLCASMYVAKHPMLWGLLHREPCTGIA
jgi:hypothetical protein